MGESSIAPEIAQNEARIEIVKHQIHAALPAYSQIDRSEYDSYSKAKDVKDRGQILYLYTNAGNSESDPRMSFIFRPSGFAVNYYNASEPNRPYTHRLKNNSVFGKKDGNWKMDEVDFAMERVRINMEGVDLSSEQFLSQTVGWSSESGGFYSMRERLEARRRSVDKATSVDERTFLEFAGSVSTVWSLFDRNPEMAKALAVARIQRKSEYVGLDGVVKSVEEVVQEISQGTPVGQKAVLREMFEIESYEMLLKSFNLL